VASRFQDTIAGVGRFKADRYWYVALAVGILAVVGGAIQIATHPELPMSADGWWENSDARSHGWALVGGGVFALLVAGQWFAVNAKRLRVPDDVRKLAKLERRRKAGQIGEAEYAVRRAEIVDADKPEP
jgi:uncharacterized membrane protein YhaH (DUF805 family)